MTFLLLACLTVASAASAEVKMPDAPVPPTPPSVVGAQIDPLTPADRDALEATIVRLDSVTTEVRRLERRIRDLRDRESTLVANLPPATKRDRIYDPNEVDHPTRPIRMTLPPISGVSRLSVRLIVDPRGHATAIEILDGPTDRTTSITEAVETWLFVPARRDGRRVPVRTTLTFRLDQDAR